MLYGSRYTLFAVRLPRIARINTKLVLDFGFFVRSW